MKLASDLIQVQNYIDGKLSVSHYHLTSLEGCPEKVDDYFNCSHNELMSFEHFPKYIGDRCYIANNLFTSFKNIDNHIKFIGTILVAYDMDITSGYSDLFGIDGLMRINLNKNNKDIQNIVNKYLPNKDLIEFQDEMIKSGYESYL